MSRFSSEFKRLRKQSGLTQREIAAALKISRSSIGMYEQGQREPDFETLEKIADYFNVKLSTLIEEPTNDEKVQMACELFQECYGLGAFTAVKKFLKLDNNDRNAVMVMMDSLLSTPKYAEKEKRALDA